MFRTPRVTAALIRSLLLGTCVAPLAVTAPLLIGCQDENQPEFWVGKLEDPAKRPSAIKRLAQFYDDALAKANKDPNNADVKGLLEKMVAPMTKVYVDNYDSLDENTREDLINVIATFRDPRTEPALKKVFEEFGKRGRGGKEVKFAARAVRDMKLKSVAPQVLATFKATKPSTKDGAYFRDVNEALLAVADPAWAGELTTMLDVDFPSMKEKNPEIISEYKDKLYQTVTAVQILGETGAAGAVPALMKTFLDPFKQDAGNEVLLALTKIGKPSVDEAIKLLQNKSPELAEYHRKQLQKQSGAERPPDGSPHVGRAVMVLGAIGRKEGIAPLIEAISSTKDDGLRTQMLTSLAMLPHTPEVKAAFLQGLKTMPNDAEFNGGNAIQALCEPSTLFFDSSFVETLVAKGEKLKKTEVLPKALLALASIKVMDESQVPAVTKFVQSLGKGEGALAPLLENVNRGLQQTSALVTACKKDAACYLAAASKNENQSNKTQLVGMKGLYMYGIITNPEGAKALIGKLNSFEEGAMRYAVSQVIDHHNPNGSVEVAKLVEAVIQPRADSPDRDKAAVDKPLRDLAYRLRARAQ